MLAKNIVTSNFAFPTVGRACSFVYPVAIYLINFSGQLSAGGGLMRSLRSIYVTPSPLYPQQHTVAVSCMVGRSFKNFQNLLFKDSTRKRSVF